MNLNKLNNDMFSQALMKVKNNYKPKDYQEYKDYKSKFNSVEEEIRNAREFRTSILNEIGPKDSDGNLLMESNGNVNLSVAQAKEFTKKMEENEVYLTNLAFINPDDLGSFGLSISEIELIEELIKD